MSRCPEGRDNMAAFRGRLWLPPVNVCGCFPWASSDCFVAVLDRLLLLSEGRAKRGPSLSLTAAKYTDFVQLAPTLRPVKYLPLCLFLKTNNEKAVTS